MAPAIRFREAVCIAGHFPLLAGLSFEVDEGEVVHLRGPNGAGKTSLLRACCGLVPVSSGEAEVLGHDLRVDRESVRREVALLGDENFLYEDLTAEENLRFALRATRTPLTALEGALNRLGLEGRLRCTPVGRLSTGQRRRVALANLVARSARLWLLDEPHAGLDEHSRGVLDELIAERRSLGMTVVLVSHEHDRAAVLADRELVVAGGQIQSSPIVPASQHLAGLPQLPEVDDGVA
jgi:heme ABC exporter ATP-binding subunit CcmA